MVMGRTRMTQSIRQRRALHAVNASHLKSRDRLLHAADQVRQAERALQHARRERPTQGMHARATVADWLLLLACMVAINHALFELFTGMNP